MEAAGEFSTKIRFISENATKKRLAKLYKIREGLSKIWRKPRNNIEKFPEKISC